MDLILRDLKFVSIGVLLFRPITVFSQELEKKALSLAIEQNLEIKHFRDNLKILDPIIIFLEHTTDKIDVYVILIPINKEIIDAAIAYKSKVERLTSQKIEELRKRNYDTYITGQIAAFTLIVYIPHDLDFEDEIVFENFANNVFLFDESKKYPLKKYTRVFDETLNSGWTKGFLYFQNFRQSSNFSYSVHFNGLKVNTSKDDNSHIPRSESWAMSYDESYMQFLSMLQNGINENIIRQNYGISAYTTAGFSSSDILNIINTVLTIISIVK
jgi:hypothetical protein